MSEANTQHDLTDVSDFQRVMIIIALSISVFMVGISLGGIVPWIALKQDMLGTDAITIGIIVAAQPLGIMLVAPLVSRIASSMGLGLAMVVFSIGTLPGLVLLPLTDSNALWIVFRLIGGLATAVPWVLGETWINMATKPKWRARTMGMYGAALAAGFALGPIFLTFFENQLDLAIVAFTVLTIVSILPLLPILRFAPTFPKLENTAFFSIIFAMPVVFFAVVLAAVADMSFATFLPLWSTAQGVSISMSLLLVSCMMVGNVVLQFPISLMADRIGVRQTMRLCGVVSLILPLLIIAVGVNLWLLFPLLFVFGGTVWTLYSLALADLGHRLSGSALAMANAAVVFVYTTSNVIGPPLSGVGLRLWEPNGFILFTILIALVFVILAYVRRNPEKAKAD
ncbi:MFS transporter [Alphaproteobacteria bacterium]|nr:MFS transporter [Alphaproteobacteria bacterium]